MSSSFFHKEADAAAKPYWEEKRMCRLNKGAEGVRCDVALSLGEPLPEVDCWLVVDILRATTTMCAFFDGGGERLYPAESVEEAFTLRDGLALSGESTLLMGERNALPPPGFDSGNSPCELLGTLFATRSIAVMVTTNGTGALLKAAATGADVRPVCARNASATLRTAIENAGRIGILCAGVNGRPGLDDVACAGLLTERLLTLGAVLEDGAQLALSVWRERGRNLHGLLASSTHGGRLFDLGFGPDIACAAEIDVSHSVLVLREEEGVFVVVRESV